MAPGGCDDDLLTAISDAVWEPVAWKDSVSSRAERLKRITEKGEKLRQQWAETAALEEAYAAPSPTLQERQRAARVHKKEMILERLRRDRRKQRLRMLLFVFYASAAVGAAVAVLFGFTDADYIATTYIVLANVGVMTMVTVRSVYLFGRNFLESGRCQGLRGSDSTSTKEKTMTTPD
ncbi:hypothetical protein ACIP6V_35135 [Streptomyces sp. NPDC088770]